MGQGYTRQASAEIQTGEDIVAAPLNSEFNALQGAFDGNSGHSHDGTLGEGPLIDLTLAITGVLPVENGGIGGVHNTSATTAPTVNDDANDGYAVGSLWINVTTDKYWICGDNTPGAAVWITESVLDPDLTAIGAVTTNGFLTRTGDNTWATRTIAVTAPLTITNANGVSGNPTLDIDNATTSTDGAMSAADKTKLDGVATGATANATNAELRDRTTHTGEQAISTVTGLETALNSKLVSSDIPALVASSLSTAPNKNTPVDNDYVSMSDSTASYGLIHVTWANIKATLKTYFDTLYAAVSHTHSNATTSVAGFMSDTDKTKMDALGTNGYGTRTISTSAPSGGSNGDIWYQV